VAKYFGQDVIRAQQGVVVPESQDSIAVDAKLAAAFDVVSLLLQVLPTIQLDNQPRFDAGEIGDIPRNGMLTPEFESAEIASTQEPPKMAFGIGKVAAQGAGIRPDSRTTAFCWSHAPTVAQFASCGNRHKASCFVSARRRLL
jgi:hypothetical protein